MQRLPNSEREVITFAAEVELLTSDGKPSDKAQEGSLLAAEQAVQEAHGKLEYDPCHGEQYGRDDDQQQDSPGTPAPRLLRLLRRERLNAGVRCGCP